MSGVPSWALSEPSTNRTAEWTTLCGWTTTSIGVVADIVQPVRLDHLQALVGERRGIDRDLGAHRPGRVAEGLRRASPSTSSSAGASRNGPPDAVRTRRAIAATARRPGTARSPSARSRSGRSQASGLASGSAGRRRGPLRGRARAQASASRGGRRRRASPCSPSRRPCPPAARRAPGRATRRRPCRRPRGRRRRASRAPRARRRRRRGSSRREVERPRRRPRGRRRPAGGGRPARRARGVAPGGEGDDAEPVRDAPRGRRRAWRPIDAGRAEERRRRAAGRPARGSADEGEDIQRDDRARRTGTSRSGRGSRRGPGSACPESFAPAARLSIDSARSPACAASPSSGPRTSAPSGRLAEARRASAVTTIVARPARRPALDRLRRRDVGQELVAADLAARRGTRPCRSSTRRGRAAGSSRARRRATRAARRRRPRAPSRPTGGRTRCSADVERPEHRREPGHQPVARIGPRTRRRPARTAPTATRTRPLRRASRDEPRLERRCATASAVPNSGERRIARRPQQPEHLHAGERRRRARGRRRSPTPEDSATSRAGRGRAPRARGSRSTGPAASARTGACGGRTRAAPRRTRRGRSPATGTRRTRAPRRRTARSGSC